MRTLRLLPILPGLLILSACESEGPSVAANNCVECHEIRQSGFNPGHAFAANDCTTCHAGNAAATDEGSAHDGMLAFPGNMDNAERACGTCHADRVASVSNSLMHTGRGIVHTTRQVIDGTAPEKGTSYLLQKGNWYLFELGDSVADSMLRKQCASCHLGTPKTVHAVSATNSRGGGCLACHIAEHPEDAHPALSADVSDARCFGCHSRSGRISLSYAGLAETDEPGLKLADGRTVERLPPDVHYTLGMRCTNCHDADDVMGSAGDAVHQRDAVSASCTDCHEPHADDSRHERLTCAACHSQWAPQCFGCHMEYSEDGEQWDHLARKMTPGRWDDERWDVRNTLPALGINAYDEIEAFVPGMIMTVAHPSWSDDKFVRMFAPLSPHTSGPSRNCASCHRSSEALGLGQGLLELENGTLRFVPAREILGDGLPADAWTNIGNTLGGRAPFPGQRPLSDDEMKKVVGADLQQDSAPGGGTGSSSASSSSVNTGGTNVAVGRSAEPAPRSPTK